MQSKHIVWGFFLVYLPLPLPGVYSGAVDEDATPSVVEEDACVVPVDGFDLGH